MAMGHGLIEYSRSNRPSLLVDTAAKPRVNEYPSKSDNFTQDALKLPSKC